MRISHIPVVALAEATEALHRIESYFFATQHPDGYWWGELESNPTMEAEYVLLTRFLDSDEGGRIGLIATDIQRRQNEDGSWNMYYGGPGDLSTTIECYFALKLAGIAPGEPSMIHARDFILRNGGLPKARIFTKIWLALFGQSDWEGTPVMPPELMLLPNRAPFSIYRMSSWARATVVPMLVVLTQHPTRELPPELGLSELSLEGPGGTGHSMLRRPPPDLFGMEQIFLLGDRLLRWHERLSWKPLRGLALRKLQRWVIEHQEADGSWGGIQPPWVYSMIALHQLGFTNDHPIMAKALDGFRQEWSIASDDAQALRVQACLSPVWDTCLVLLGLLDGGIPADHPASQRAARWLLRKEIRVPGDWSVKAPHIEPSGWAFEFHNDLYPDIDDTSIIVMGLTQVRMSDEAEERQRKAAVQRAVQWLLAMQSSNGGWAAFDKDNTSKLIAKMPFFDFGDALDPPSADVTAHIVEMFGRLGYDTAFAPVRRAVDYLKGEQETDGCWFGRWGVNFVYGTGAVLPALKAIGEDMDQPYIRKAVDWLVAHQNPDGGWGETCASYVDPSLRGQGESTASQSAWALIALLASEETHHPGIQAGIAYLVSTQQSDGTWDEPQFTGCGLPGYGIGDQPKHYPAVGDHSGPDPKLGAAFMINYHLYRNYFPLWALGRYTQKINNRNGKGTRD